MRSHLPLGELPSSSRRRHDASLAHSGGGRAGNGDGRDRGNTFVYAGEIAQIVLPNIPIPSSVSRARLSLRGAEWKLASEWERPDIAILESRTALEGNAIAVRGRAANRDTTTLPSVSIVALFFDAFGNPLGASATEIEGLLAGEMRSFAIFHPPFPNLDPQKTIVSARAKRPQ